MATWRKVKRRNMGPFSRPVQADTAGLVLMIVVTWLLDMPSVMRRSRNMKPNCCRHGYSESCKGIVGRAVEHEELSIVFKQTAAASFTYIGQAGGDAHQPRPAAIGGNKVGAQIALILAIVVAPPALGQRLRCGCVDLLLHHPVLKEYMHTHTQSMLITRNEGIVLCARLLNTL